MRRTPSTKRTVTVILAVIFVSATLVSFAYRIGVGNRAKIIKNHILTCTDIAQIIAHAVDSEDNGDSFFYAIPEAQRSELTSSQFDRYINAIKRAFPHDITSIEELTPSEVIDYVNAHLPSSTADEVLLNRSRIYWFHSMRSGQNTKLAVAIPRYTNGIAYLDHAWITRTSNLFDYATLYFAAITARDKGGLADLLVQGEPLPHSVYLVQACNLKAEIILNHYVTHGLSAEMVHLENLMPYVLTVSQKNAPAPTEPMANREVDFIAKEGRFYAVEPISDTIDKNGYTLNLSQNTSIDFSALGVANQLSSASLEPDLGPPIDIVAYSGEAEHTRYTVIYPGLSLTLTGTLDLETGKWSGYVSSATIKYSKYQLKNGLAPGRPVSVLYMAYPFMRENNFHEKASVNNAVISLKPQVEESIISSLTLEINTKEATVGDKP